MSSYNFDVANLLTKIWIALASLFLFGVVMFGVRDPVMSSIMPFNSGVTKGGSKSKTS